MTSLSRIEQALEQQFALIQSPAAPGRLSAALHHAVFPGGARIRPQLCLAVAMACGDDDPALTNAAACAIELIHCASLVHDDMPCFDNADVRRGRPTVFRQFGEPLALLSGDGLIVLAFQGIARAGLKNPLRMAQVLDTVAIGAGAPDGIVAGQAWECESRVDLGQYQRAKTGALFVASTRAGAQAAGADPAPWGALGDSLGEAYQVADDIRDVMGQVETLGKPVGQDRHHGRPSSATDLGLAGAVEHFRTLIEAAVESVPPCGARDHLRQLVLMESERLIPQEQRERIAAHPLARLGGRVPA